MLTMDFVCYSLVESVNANPTDYQCQVIKGYAHWVAAAKPRGARNMHKLFPGRQC